MLILADEEIPCIEYYFGSYGEITLKSGRSLTRHDVLDADILLVRSVTQINETLLHDTKVKFVGSMAAGIDHLDTVWLDKAGIRWSAASGCNAEAVAEYVVAVVAVLQTQGLLLQKSCRAGVVGVGKVGSKVVEKLKQLGFEVLQCDPLRAEQEKDFISTPIEEFSDLDFILLHTPLTKGQYYPTYHLIEKKFLRRQKKECILLNAGRGSVINFTDLLQYGQHLIWCLDVWENEPAISKDILFKTMIASPHIAGHSVQSKYRGIDSIFKVAIQQNVIPDKNISSVLFPRTEISFGSQKVNWREVVLAVYNPLEISRLMKQAFLEQGDHVFDELRKRFKRGHEFEFVDVKGRVTNRDDLNMLRTMSFKL